MAGQLVKRVVNYWWSEDLDLVMDGPRAGDWERSVAAASTGDMYSRTGGRQDVNQIGWAEVVLDLNDLLVVSSKDSATDDFPSNEVVILIWGGDSQDV